MDELLHLLVSLQDLDTLIREAEDEGRREELEGMGFTMDNVEKLHAARNKLVGRIDGPAAVVSPDAGGVKRAERYARHLEAYVAFIHKRRAADVHNVSEALAVVGEVSGRHCIIVDDIIDTAGTVVNAAELLQKKGALSVRVMATHGVLSDPAIDRLFFQCE